MSPSSTPFDPDHPFAVMVDRVRDCAIFLIDPDGRIASWNPGAAAMKGYAADEIIGQPLEVLYPDAAREAGEPRRNLETARRDGTVTVEGWRRRKDGSLFWALAEIIALTDADGVHSGFCKITKDLTRHKQLQEALQHERERVQVILDAIGDAVLALDADGRIAFLNPKAEQLSGWTTAELRGRDFAELLVLGDAADEPGRTRVARLCDGEALSASAATLLRTRDGRHCVIDGVGAPIRTASGDAGCVIVFRDATRIREHLDALTYQATHDALTGLVNRAGFDARLQRSIERVAAGSTSSALVYIDLDGFKAVNDSAGHHAGDEMLRRVGQVVTRQIRERDTLARLGGDEFVLLLDGCSRDAADVVAEKVRRAISAISLRYGGQRLKVGASVGVTMITAGDSAVDALHRADMAAYAAKARARAGAPAPRLN